MKGFIAFVCTIVLGIIWLPISFIYSMFVHRFSSNFFLNNSITIDILGNINGELLELIVTKQRNTLFGTKGVTISASLGYLEVRCQLNKRGKWLSKTLDKAFSEKNHCVNAYNSYIRKNLD